MKSSSRFYRIHYGLDHSEVYNFDFDNKEEALQYAIDKGVPYPYVKRRRLDISSMLRIRKGKEIVYEGAFRNYR